MSWCGIEGHDLLVDRFRRSLMRRRLASSYLFVGPPGVGKRLFALRLAQGLLCQTSAAEALNPCQTCPACLQIAAGTHPDVDVVERTAGKKDLTVELFIGDHEHRSREGLCYRLSLRPSTGNRRIAIIDDADWLNDASANCLLKTLEEPPPGALLILIGTGLQRQRPTIRSRCQIVLFQPLSQTYVRQYLISQQLLADNPQADHLARLAQGSLERARQLADQALRPVEATLARLESERVPDTHSAAKEIQALVDAIGSDAADKRDRLRQVVLLAIALQRSQLRRLAEAAEPGDGATPSGDRLLEITGRRLDRSIRAIQEIDANANLPTLIECWLDDLSQASARTT